MGLVTTYRQRLRGEAFLEAIGRSRNARMRDMGMTDQWIWKAVDRAGIKSGPLEKRPNRVGEVAL